MNYENKVYPHSFPLSGVPVQFWSYQRNPQLVHKTLEKRLLLENMSMLYILKLCSNKDDKFVPVR